MNILLTLHGDLAILSIAGLVRIVARAKLIYFNFIQYGLEFVREELNCDLLRGIGVQLRVFAPLFENFVQEYFVCFLQALDFFKHPVLIGGARRHFCVNKAQFVQEKALVILLFLFTDLKQLEYLNDNLIYVLRSAHNLRTVDFDLGQFLHDLGGVFPRAVGQADFLHDGRH